MLQKVHFYPFAAFFYEKGLSFLYFFVFLSQNLSNRGF